MNQHKIIKREELDKLPKHTVYYVLFDEDEKYIDFEHVYTKEMKDESNRWNFVNKFAVHKVFFTKVGKLL